MPGKAHIKFSLSISFLLSLDNIIQIKAATPSNHDLHFSFSPNYQWLIHFLEKQLNARDCILVTATYNVHLPDTYKL